MELPGCEDECRRTANFCAALPVTKCSAWLLSNESPHLSRSKSNLHPLTSSPCRRHTQNTRFTRTLCSQSYGKSKQPCRNVRIWSSGEWNGWPV